EAGREPQEIRRAYNVSGRIGPRGDGPLDVPTSRWVETLTDFVLQHGMDTFIFWPSENHIQQTELFASEVVPAVRDAVRAGRS
nr:LLM class flavin-dependent oxidoreductase [Rubrobacter sp.]